MAPERVVRGETKRSKQERERQEPQHRISPSVAAAPVPQARGPRAGDGIQSVTAWRLLYIHLSPGLLSAAEGFPQALLLRHHMVARSRDERIGRRPDRNPSLRG